MAGLWGELGSAPLTLAVVRCSFAHVHVPLPAPIATAVSPVPAASIWRVTQIRSVCPRRKTPTAAGCSSRGVCSAHCARRGAALLMPCGSVESWILGGPGRGWDGRQSRRRGCELLPETGRESALLRLGFPGLWLRASAGPSRSVSEYRWGPTTASS